MESSNPDQQAIDAAIAGDGVALGALLRAHGPRLREQIRIDSRWQSVLDMDDVMQVTYMEAYLKIGSFTPGGPNAFPGWLKRIAENNLRDAIRALEAQKRPPPGMSLSIRTSEDSLVELFNILGVSGATPSRNAAATEMKTAVEAALAAMPPDYAAVIRRYDLEGMPIGEVAKAMGRTPGAIHMLRARAHDRLKELFGSGSQFFSNTA